MIWSERVELATFGGGQRTEGIAAATKIARGMARRPFAVKEGARNQSGVQVMPAFKDTLSPAEIQAVIAKVKALRQ